MTNSIKKRLRVSLFYLATLTLAGCNATSRSRMINEPNRLASSNDVGAHTFSNVANADRNNVRYYIPNVNVYKTIGGTIGTIMGGALFFALGGLIDSWHERSDITSGMRSGAATYAATCAPIGVFVGLPIGVAMGAGIYRLFYRYDVVDVNFF